MKRLGLFVGAAILTGVATVEAQQVNWVEPSQSQAPPPRCCMGMAYDFATQSIVIFGGFTNPTTLGDTWILRQEWSQLSPVTSPSPRYSPGMAWDGAAENVVLFGGQNSSGESLNDTWTWNGRTWTQQFPPVSPPARSFGTQGITYDNATRNVVLFGGLNSAGVAFGDTWTWNGRAKTWTQHFPAASPSPRQAPTAYDAAVGMLVLFGGDNNAGLQFADTWTWDGTTWTERFPPSAPSPRTLASLAYDANLGVVVLFGGYAGSWPNSLNDTWTLNGTTWKQMNPATVPPNRYAFGMDYDPLGKGVVMFGGFSSGPGRNDTWIWTLVP
jgi:Galactose oxidase, central domain